MKLLSLISLFFLSIHLVADEAKRLNFNEIFDLVRTNVSDLSEAELEERAARGFLKEMGSLVQLVTTNVESAAQPPDTITKKAVFDDHFGYVRIRAVDERLPADFQRNITELVASEGLKGIILDLRYAEGTDYEAAADVAGHFIGGQKPLLQIGTKEVRAKEQLRTVRLPIAVLVNGETRAAAEALAAVLKESASGLVIGKKTMGEARLFEVFTLSNGQQVRIGKVPIAVVGGKVIDPSGIDPDITVVVDPDEEKLFYQDPYRERKMLAGGARSGDGATNRVRPFNEAELVRQHREGFDFSSAEQAQVARSPVLTDPTLARAIDFLKGVSILKPKPQF